MWVVIPDFNILHLFPIPESGVDILEEFFPFVGDENVILQYVFTI